MDSIQGTKNHSPSGVTGCYLTAEIKYRSLLTNLHHLSSPIQLPAVRPFDVPLWK